MSKLETARGLAKAHFQVEPHLKYVFVLKPLHDQDPRTRSDFWEWLRVRLNGALRRSHLRPIRPTASTIPPW